jgi:hypothetical protein
MPLSPAQRALYGRIGSAIARSRHDPRELTAAARRSFLDRFEREIRESFPALSDAEVRRRAGEARRAYFLRLAAKSAAARAKRKVGQ